MSFKPRPSVRELPADLQTPVGAYLRIRELGPGFLLESIERGQQVGRYSFLAAGCESVSLDHAAPDLFAPLRSFLAGFEEVDQSGLPPFAGGVVGHLGYDAITAFEPTVPIPAAADGDVEHPSRFLLVPVVVAFDHVRQRVQVIAQPGHDRLADEIALRLQGPLPESALPAVPLSGRSASHAETTPEGYMAGVARCKRHIAAGDAFQIVLSQRHLRQTTRSPAAVYRALRTVNPSPYMFFLETGGPAIVGASPETHVSLAAGGVAGLRPIAGTRPRGATPAEDDALAAELEVDEKERAEHLMLVDLARNDLSRVCATGTVRPTRMLEVERYSHVMHLVSHVEGRLGADRDAFSLLAATFPAGTVSGAPKVRAMQIISALEPQRRGIYAGAIGYIGFSDAMDTCIALRTIVMREGVAVLQAGAGLVADSDPASEHQECLNKIAALRTAIDLAETGVYGAMSRVLLIDHYDSFTYNLADGLAQHGAEVLVFRHDAIGVAEAAELRPTHLVLSPGPGRPAETGVSAALVGAFHAQIPILGVCLGHQLLVELEGGRVDQAARLVHGKTTMVSVLAVDPLLAGLPSPFAAGRYHSLAAIEPFPASLLLTARAADGEVMAVRHVAAPTHGVQFHPESVLTPDGSRLLRNFLEMRA